MARRKERRKTAFRPRNRPHATDGAIEQEDQPVRAGSRKDSQPTPFSMDPGRLWPYVVAVLMLPLLVLWHNDNALYTPLWYADPWFYLGYFRDLLEFKRDLFDGFYYGSRLSWILPGFVIHSLFSPVAANSILHLTVQSTATLSFFSILRLTTGVRSAFLATMVFAVHPWLWVATGWDYPDGAGIAYCLLTMALLTRSAMQPGRKWSLLGSGAALAGMAYTHLFLGTLTPLLLLYYIGLAWTCRRTPVGSSVLALLCWAGAGFAILSLVFCGINYLLDGTFWFYAPSLGRAQSMAKDFQFTRSIWANHQVVPWLWPGIAGSFTAIAMLLSRTRSAEAGFNWAGRLLAAQLLLAVSYMAYLQNRGTTVLGHFPYVSYLLPFVFLVMGISFWPAARTMTLRAYLSICCVGGIVFVALWYNPYGYLTPASPAAQRATVIVSACALAMAFLLRQRQEGAWLAVTGFAAFTAVALAQTVNLGGLDLHGSREQYQRIMHARDRIEAVRKGRTVRFWFNKQEPNVHEYTGLNALYLEEFSQVGTSFPGGCDGPVDPGTLVVVVSLRDHAAELARSALVDCWRPLAMRPEIEAVEVVQRPGQPYTMAMLRAVADVSLEPRPEDLFRTIALERVRLGDSKASLKQGPGGLLVTTLPDYGAFAGRVTLGIDASLKTALAVHVRARVLQGKVGLGILDSASKTFLLQSSLRPSTDARDVILPLPSPPVTGDLVISNTLRNGVISKVMVESIEIRKIR
jgi:hypothetical protein